MTVLTTCNSTVIMREIKANGFITITIIHDQMDTRTYTKIIISGVSKGVVLKGKYTKASISALGNISLSTLNNLIHALSEQPLETTDHATFIACKFIIGHDTSLVIIATKERTDEDMMFDLLKEISINASIGTFSTDERECAARNAIGEYRGKCNHDNLDNITIAMKCGLSGMIYQREKSVAAQLHGKKVVKNDQIDETSRVKELIAINTKGTLKELNMIAKQLGMKRYSALNKASLISYIAEHINKTEASAA